MIYNSKTDGVFSYLFINLMLGTDLKAYLESILRVFMCSSGGVHMCVRMCEGLDVNPG